MKDRWEPASETFAILLDTIATLRDPEKGCPWDLAQTHASLRATLLEESYEVIEALGGDEVPAIVEELGDLLVNILLNTEIGRTSGTFTIDEVLSRVTGKLVSRHPHVFGDMQIHSAEEVRVFWDKIKASERKEGGRAHETILDGVPKNMPALAYAQAVQGRVARSELTADEQNEIEFGVMANIGSRVQTMLNKENIGDFLFWAVSFSRRIGVDAEQALRESSRKTVAKFNDLAKSQRDMADE